MRTVFSPYKRLLDLCQEDGGLVVHESSPDITCDLTVLGYKISVTKVICILAFIRKLKNPIFYFGQYQSSSIRNV